MTAPRTHETELANLRSRLQATLRDPSRPLAIRMAEYRRLLRESRLLAANFANTWRTLQDSL